MKSVTIKNSGNTISLEDDKFSFTKTNDGAQYNNNEKLYKVDIDQFGMDEFYHDVDDFANCSVSIKRTDDKKIQTEVIGLFNSERHEREDTGEATAFAEDSQSLRTWEANKKYLTKNYPITKAWFNEREGVKSDKEVPPESSENKLGNASIEGLYEQNKTLRNILNEMQQIYKEQAKTIQKKNEETYKLQKMLSSTLELCEKVKKSFVGKMFFGKDVKLLKEINEER